VRAGVPEVVAMRISGHKTRSVFDRYNVTSEVDLQQAANRLNQYFSEKMVTIPVTPDQYAELMQSEMGSEVVENTGGEGGIRTHGPFRVNGLPDHPIRSYRENRI